MFPNICENNIFDVFTVFCTDIENKKQGENKGTFLYLL